ncbi:exocyst complex component 3-like [Hemiscyllium ocellatum]|uniref:exocyst complex component 3-like n=1 Tax=Hemiscyllium ocellatum TaxID=170820 RepID=UPI002967509B|nr:exocyst complex component 3-like [Hemiscyllium ocellatum]
MKEKPAYNSKERLNTKGSPASMVILTANGMLRCGNTEKDIKELIEQQRYFKADQHLIKLEYERSTNDVTNDESTKKEEKDINSLYELLSAEIFNVVKESFNISKEHPNLLKMAVQVKIQEEKADQIYLEEKEKSGSVPEFRPRQWDTKWLSVLQHSVNERISEPLGGSEDNKTDWLTQYLVQLRSQLKADFDTIVNCINPCYPEESNICLNIMIAVIPSEDTRQQLLNTLLPEKTINHLENEYFSVLRSDARMCMIKSLHIEEENWRSGKEPLVLNDCYHSELPIDIIQPHCKKLVTEKWLECTEPIDEILEITEKHLTKLKKLKAPHYQDLLMEIYQQLMTEYILRIMKKRLSCKTENQEKQVADQIQNETQHLQKLFNFYGSEDTVLESALLKIAEIIRLKDVDAIIVEVAALFRDFPDIGKEHVRAILSMKVSVKRSDEKKILKILNTPMNDSNSSIKRKLFSNPTLFKAL